MHNLQNFTLIELVNIILTLVFLYLTIKGIIILKRKNKTIYNTYVVNNKMKRVGYIIYTLSLLQIIHYILFYNSTIFTLINFYPVFFLLGPLTFYGINEIFVNKNLINLLQIIFIIYVLFLLFSILV